MSKRDDGSTSTLFLLGKPLRTQTVIADVVERLHRSCPTITLHCPRTADAIPGWMSQPALVVQRGLGISALASAQRLEQAGVRCCNSIDTTRTCNSRAAVMAALATASLPVPQTQVAETWPSLLRAAGHGPIVVKRVEADKGRGMGVLVAADGRLPIKAPFRGPYITQEHVSGSTSVHKLYIVGQHVSGLIKESQTSASANTAGVPFEVTPELTRLAQITGEVLGLEIFGVDVLFNRNGPVLIDVNPFPGFRGVPDAARRIAKYLETLLNIP